MIGLYDWLTPSLTVLSPSLVQSVLIKDFDHFVDRRTFHFNDEILDEMLTTVTGNHWKGIRSVLTPTFTSGKMKNMFHLVAEKADQLVKACRDQRDHLSRITMPSLFGSFAMDVIGSCAFGMEINSLKNENSAFVDNARALFKTSKTRMARFLIMVLFPKLAKRLGVNLSTPQINSLAASLRQTIAARQGSPKRGDFVDLMLEARDSNDEQNLARPHKYKLSDNSIVAQSLLFIVAGYDTTSNSLTTAVHCLAKYTSCQQKVRTELAALGTAEDITYQDIMEAPYLDAFVAEALRLFPPTTFTERRCTKTYTIPGSSITVPEGMMVSVPIWSLHRDEEYYPDPEQFKPERFLSGNKEKIPSGAYLPFGMGPRMCIAQRFALMGIKLAIAKIVLNFQLDIAEGFEEIKYKMSPGTQRPEENMMVVMKAL
ncbi:cytochrome P450 3A24-like [Hyalella azteca]|uniref:Cytochrome P450 3A24-like n=1 Tax=Hyalella azteca TaxID=294128 RepID=A0A8B7NNF1_HYAAZ|nr:cytochrome P450 3A24-like [Hyalella azteca]